VAVPAEEVVEVALVLVVRIEARVRVRAHEVPAGAARLQKRDVVDVHAGRLGRVEDVRHVNEDGDVLAHWYSYSMRRRGGRGPPALRSSRSRPGWGDGASDVRTLICESLALPAGPLRWVVRLWCFDRGTALVRGRSKGLADELGG